MNKLAEYYQELATNRPEWSRKGQHAFNALLDYFPEFAEEIRATQLDPFYHDERIPALFEELNQRFAQEKD